ncbi:hypothetical protein PAMP_020009 [Pampus punctatissimus]
MLLPPALSAASRVPVRVYIFVLTGLSDESQRRPGPLPAFLKQIWPYGATWRPAKMNGLKLSAVGPLVLIEFTRASSHTECNPPLLISLF